MNPSAGESDALANLGPGRPEDHLERSRRRESPLRTGLVAASLFLVTLPGGLPATAAALSGGPTARSQESDLQTVALEVETEGWWRVDGIRNDGNPCYAGPTSLPPDGGSMGRHDYHGRARRRGSRR